MRVRTRRISFCSEFNLKRLSFCHGIVKDCDKSERMKILIFHPVLLPVSHYGGSERVLMWLAKTLAQMGHSVTVFAAHGSIMPTGIECITDLEVLTSKIKEFDLLHGFSRIDPRLEELASGKVLFTVQGNGQAGERFHKNTVFVSRDHAKRHGSEIFVYNGLDPSELSFSDRPRPNRFLFLSKTSWKVCLTFPSLNMGLSAKFFTKTANPI